MPADIVFRSLSGDTAEKRFAFTPKFSEYAPRISPDGKWVAYYSNEFGQDRVYVRPFPGTGGQVTVSVTGGAKPVWLRDGSTIFSVNRDQFMAASVVTNPTFSVTARKFLF